MRNLLDNFESDQDRGSPKTAAILFARLFPDVRIRRACADRFARSIEHAHKHGGASWSVTMFGWGVRLIVGQVLVMQLDSKEVVAYERTARGRSVYSAVRTPSRIIGWRHDEIAGSTRSDWQSHEQFIEAAVAAKKSSPWKTSFSEGVLRYCERILERRLPRPDYIGTSQSSHRRSGYVARAGEMAVLEATAIEGRRILTAHFRIERKRSIIEKKKHQVLNEKGCLACEVCKFDFRAYGNIGDDFCEVHHHRQLSKARSSIETSMEDLAIVCSNCHRMIHHGGKNRPLSEVQASLRLGRRHRRIS